MTKKEEALLKEVERAIERNPIGFGHYVMEALVVRRTRTAFRREFVKMAGPRAYAEGAGLVLGDYLEGHSHHILQAARAALEDANHHDAAALLVEEFPQAFEIRK